MNLTRNKNNWWVLLAALAWLLYTLGTYLYHHPTITEALSYFHYPKVVLAAIGISLLSFWGMSGFKRDFKWKRDLQFYPIVAWLAFFTVLVLLYYRILQQTVPEGMPLDEMSRNFTILSLKYFLLLAMISLSAASWGHLLLNWITGSKQDFGVWVNMAFGFSILCTLTFFQALIMPINTIFLWILLALPIPFGIPYLARILKKFFWTPTFLTGVSIWTVPIAAILGLFIALSWIASIKLFPTGYDGLTYYGNLANIIGENGELIGGFQPYQWSLLMSYGWHLLDDPALGFLLGYLPGWLALGALYKIARRYLDIDGSLIVLLLWMSLPVSTFHYGQTEKVDLALHFVLLSGVLFYLQSCFMRKGRGPDGAKIALLGLNFDSAALSWMLLGWLMGFALGIKLTAFFLLFAWSCLLFYRQGRYPLLRWGFLVLLGAFFGFGLERAAGADYGSYVIRISGLILMTAGIYEIHKRYGLWSGELKTIYSHLLALVLGAFLSFAPWPVKNALDSGTLEVQRVLTGPKEQPAIQLEKPEKPEINLPAGGKLAGLIFLGTSRREELGKFLGFDEGFYKYFTVLFKITANPGMETRSFVNIGFYLLFALPLLLFFPANSRWWHPWGPLVFLLFFISIGNYLVWEQPELGTLSSKNALISKQPQIFQDILTAFPQKLNELFYQIGFYLDQLPLLGSRSWRILNVFLAVALLLLLRQFSGGLLQKLKKKEKTLLILVGAYLFMWYITGSGIPWYGFTGMALLFILLQLIIQKTSKPIRTTHAVALGLSFALLFLYRFSGASSGKKPASDPELVLNSPLLYSSGAYKNPDDILKSTNATFYKAAQILNADKNTEIYIAGTLFNYFIDDNHVRVHQDNQFEEFSAIRRANEADPDYFLKVLIDNGFEFIVFNPSDINYDRTPEQTFRKKFDNFIQVLSQSDLVDLVLTDNKVKNAQGQVVSGIQGTPVNYGQLAVLQLKTY